MLAPWRSAAPLKQPSSPGAHSAVPPLLLHHRAATRLAVGTLPLLVCVVALVARDGVALTWPRDAAASAIARASLPWHAALLLAAVALVAPVTTTLRTGGPTASVRVARFSAFAFVVPSAFAARDALAFCPAGGADAACADVALAAILAPIGPPFFLVSGLPPRYAFALELLRLGGGAAVVFATLHAAPGGLAAAWAARYAAKCAACAAVSPVLLRAALGADEPRELALLSFTPRPLRPLRDALLAAGAACAGVPALHAVPPALLALLLAYFASLFSRALLGQPDDRLGTSSHVARHVILACWALGFGTAVAQAARMSARRAARHTRHLADQRVHALHLKLSTLEEEEGADTGATLATAATQLLSAFPPGCSVALAEWTTVSLGAAAAAAVAAAAAAASRRTSESAAAQGGASPRRVALSRVLARSPRPPVERALRAAVRRGCARQGSAAAALAKPGAAAGLTLDSEDFAEGAAAFPDWAALIADAAAGPGVMSLSLVGSGSSVVGALWVHTPEGVLAPAPATVREYAECIGAVLLRNRAHRAALLAAAADARADADATLALQRTFLSGITHELRTPLNAVVGFTSTVLEGAQLTPTDADYLRCSMTAANTLLSIIDQLLDYAKWAQGDASSATGQQHAVTQLAAAPLRLCTVLDELVDVVGGKAAAAGVGLRVETCRASQSAHLLGDGPRLRQVLVNLTDNALKFTRRGGAVTVSACMCVAPRRDATSRPLLGSEEEEEEVQSSRSSFSDDSRSVLSQDEDAPPDIVLDTSSAATAEGAESPPSSRAAWLRIAVKDSGIGVPPEQQWRLFNPFSQVPENAAQGVVKPSGTGLGLVISRAIIREMGGDITFTSLPGVGTTFTILVPFQTDDSAATAAEAASSAPASALAGATLLPLLRDGATGAMMARMAATWGAKTVALPQGCTPDDVAAAVEALAAARADPDAPLILVVDPPSLVTLRRVAMPPLPHAVCCVLAAPAAEHAAWTGAAAFSRGVMPPDFLLALPTSPGRLLARLRAAAASVAAPQAGSSVASSPSLSPSASTAPPPGVAALRVLLAEDNAMNAAVARAVLARCGVKMLRVVGDGEAAVAAFADASPPWSIILLDVKMPKLSGPGAAVAIRALEAAQPHRQRTRIVAVTANSAEEDRQECLAAGMDDFMVKPITPAAMRATLARAVEDVAAAA